MKNMHNKFKSLYLQMNSIIVFETPAEISCGVHSVWTAWAMDQAINKNLGKFVQNYALFWRAAKQCLGQTTGANHWR